MSSVQQEQILNCGNYGLFYDGSCQCDLGYFGQNCEQRLEELHIEAYFTFIGFFLILFSLLLLVTTKQFQISLKMNKIPSYQKGISYIRNVLGSPLNCILCLTIFFSILKIIWLALDPFQLYNFKEMVAERILAEVVYTILFYIYGILLMVWYTMYDEISFNIAEKQKQQKSLSASCLIMVQDNRKYVFVYYKDIMKIRLFLVLLIQLTVSTLNGLRLGQQYKAILYVAYALLLLNFISFIFEFLLYGRSLNQCIEQQLKRLDKDNKDNQQKINELTILSKTQMLAQPDENIQSPATPDQQILRLSSISLSEESHDQIPTQTQRNIQSHDKSLFHTSLKKQVTFMSPQNIPTQQNTETKREIQRNLAKSIISEESQSSLPQNDDVYIHQKVNSCLINENDSEQLENFNWSLEKERKKVKKLKKKQMKVVEITKQTVSETKRQKKITLKINNRDILEPQISEEDKKINKIQIEINYQAEMLAQQKQIKTANLNADKKVLSKIQLLIYAGVFLEICFGALSIVILVTDLLTTSIGTMCYFYISGMLQFLSLITVLKLFRDVRSQEVLNLIWIQKVGNRKNKINQQYLFTIPQKQKQNDESKRKFEQRINMHIG